MEMPVTPREIEVARGHLLAWLRWHMRSQGITQQKDLADRLGVSKGTITHWFKRETQLPNFTALLSISKEVGVSLDTLTTRDPPPLPSR